MNDHDELYDMIKSDILSRISTKKIKNKYVKVLNFSNTQVTGIIKKVRKELGIYKKPSPMSR